MSLEVAGEQANRRAGTFSAFHARASEVSEREKLASNFNARGQFAQKPLFGHGAQKASAGGQFEGGGGGQRRERARRGSEQGEAARSLAGQTQLRARKDGPT